MHVSIFNYQSAAGTKQIAFVAFERHLTYGRVASILYDEYKNRIQSLDAIVLRPPVDVPLKKPPVKKVATVIKRFPHLPLYVLYSHEYVITLSKNYNKQIVPDLALHAQADFISVLQSRQLEKFVVHSAALFKSPHGTIFRMPSQEYSHTFLRVGNIQVSRHVLDSIFFWTIPYLKGAGSILTDSWSISSIALNIARLLCRYDNHVKLEQFHVNMLTSHFDGQKTMDPDTENSLYTLSYGNDKKILFLISSIKTQKSLENIQRAISTIDNFSNEMVYLALYKLVQSPSVTALCTLGDEFCEKNGVIFDSFGEPPVGEQVVEIDNKVFFPIKIKESEIELNPKCTEASRDFFRKYENRQIFYIHRDSFYINRDKYRHHGIYIDVSMMLSSEHFLTLLQEKLDGFQEPPSLIIYPPHEHGRDFVTQIKARLQDKFGIVIPDFQVLDLDFAIMDEKNQLIKLLTSKGKDDFILVVDDVSTTGSRLRKYQQGLRSFYTGRIGYLVGVARPDNIKTWEQSIKYLRYRAKVKGKAVAPHDVMCVEQVVIPDWNERECPWCIEKRCIERTLKNPKYQTHAVARALKNRYHQLNKGSEIGLVDNVFASIGKVPKPAFQGGSIFAPNSQVSEADLVAAISSGLQHVRVIGGTLTGSKELEKLETEYPHFKIVRMDDYLGEKASFNEALIKAVIFRMAYKRELHAIEEANVQRQKEGILQFLDGHGLSEGERGFFEYELYLALKERKLPKPDPNKKLFSILESAFTKSNPV